MGGGGGGGFKRVVRETQKGYREITRYRGLLIGRERSAEE